MNTASLRHAPLAALNRCGPSNEYDWQAEEREREDAFVSKRTSELYAQASIDPTMLSEAMCDALLHSDRIDNSDECAEFWRLFIAGQNVEAMAIMRTATMSALRDTCETIAQGEWLNREDVA